MGLIGIKPGFSQRAVNALDHWLIHLISHDEIVIEKRLDLFSSTNDSDIIKSGSLRDA